MTTNPTPKPKPIRSVVAGVMRELGEKVRKNQPQQQRRRIMPTEWEQVIMETLRDTRQVLALCDQGRSGHINAPEDTVVRELCERIGYGAVMDSAQRSWEAKDNIGCFTCGPCLSTVRSAIECIDKLLTVYDTFNTTTQTNSRIDNNE